MGIIFSQVDSKYSAIFSVKDDKLRLIWIKVLTIIFKCVLNNSGLNGPIQLIVSISGPIKFLLIFLFNISPKYFNNNCKHWSLYCLNSSSVALINSWTTSKTPSLKAGGHSASFFMKILNKISKLSFKYIAASELVICSMKQSSTSQHSSCTRRQFDSDKILMVCCTTFLW